MPKGKAAKGPKVTLKTAKNAIQRTEEGQRRLSLSKMGITVFPKCLVKLTNVDELDLSRNLIQKIPNEIGKMSSLKSLDLHSNKLESVPESIGNLVKLTHLNLSNNCLTSAGIPSTLGFLTSLKTLNLGMNQLDMLPPTLEALDSLEELGLFDNLFIKPPEFLTVLCNLTKVNMERNPLNDAPKHGKKKTKKTSEPEGDEVASDSSSSDNRTYPGLIVPNSVARVSQDVWRMKKVEHNLQESDASPLL